MTTGGLPIRYLPKSVRQRTKSARKLAPRAARRKLIDRDKLNAAAQSDVARTCVKLFDHIQGQPREVQLLSLAATFVILSRALEFDPSDTYQAITNLMRDPKNASGTQYQFDAMKFHVESELKGEAHGG